MFWLYEDELPAGVGNEPFCTAHLLYLVGFVTLAVCYALFYRKQDEDCRNRADRILSLAVLFFGLCEYGGTALLGHFSRYALPLHVCSLMFFLAPLHALTGCARPGSFAAQLHGFFGAVLFHPGLPGALAALLFPDWLYYPFWNYLSVSSFLAHGLLAVYGASVLVRIAEARDPKGLFLHDLRASAFFLGFGALVMFFFDRAFGVNYWFMAGPGLDSPFLGAYVRGGRGGYLLAFAFAALAVTAVWYGLRYILLSSAKERAIET